MNRKWKHIPYVIVIMVSFLLLLAACGEAPVSSSSPVTTNTSRTYYDFVLSQTPDTSLKNDAAPDYSIRWEQDYPRQDWLLAAKEALRLDDDYCAERCSAGELRALLEQGTAEEGWYLEDDGRPGVIYNTGLYMDFDGDGEEEGVIVISTPAKQFMVSNMKQVYYCRDGQPPQLVDTTSLLALSTIEYQGFRHFAACTADGCIAGHKYEIFQVNEGIAESVFCKSDIYAPVKNHIFLEFSFPQNFRNARLLLFWDELSGRYRSLGGVPVSEDDFLRYWNPEGVEPNNWFTTGELSFHKGQFQTIECYGNYFYCVEAEAEVKLGCFYQNETEEWQAAHFDSIEARDGIGDPLPVYDVDFRSACESAVPPPQAGIHSISM